MSNADINMKPEIVTRKLSELRGWELNPRTVDKESFERLKEQIKRLGVYKPLLINQQNIVLGGNMRLKVFQELKLEEIICSRVLTDNEAQMMEYALSDNDQIGVTDEEAVAEFASLHPIKSVLFAINSAPMKLVSSVIDELSPEEVEEDDVPEVEEKAKSVLGEIYQLGKHRIMCGDSTKEVGKLMDGKKAFMVFTDPPWNVNYGNSGANPRWKTGADRTIENDNLGEDFLPFLQDSVGQMADNSEQGCPTYVVMSAQEWGVIMQVMENASYHWSSTIIWAKDQMVLSRKDYHTQYEPIWYGWLDGTRLQPVKDRTQTDLWEIPRPKVSEEHPTMKPIALCAKAIKNSSKAGDIVLDPFLGSGSTLIAAEQTNRICYGMELDPKYVDVIRKRYAQLIGRDDWETATPSVK